MVAEALVWMRGAGAVPGRAFELLSRNFRMVQPADSVPSDSERFHLWGADAALQLAAERPEAIETLVLESPTSTDEALLSQIDVPTLVIYGTRDSRSEKGRLYREKMSNCQFVLVYDAGPDVAVDRPEAFASLVADFLTRREAFIVNQRSSLINP